MILKHSKIDLTKEELQAKSFIQFVAELQNLISYIGNHLQHMRETVSIAENVTAGFLQFSFSQMKNAFQFFKGGITAFNHDELMSVLQVENLVDSKIATQNVAEQMAKNVTKIYKTDWAIAVTGYSVAVPESGNKLFAYFSMTYRGETVLSERLDLHSRTMPLKAQMYYSEFILGCFKLELDKLAENRFNDEKILSAKT